MKSKPLSRRLVPLFWNLGERVQEDMNEKLTLSKEENNEFLMENVIYSSTN